MSSSATEPTKDTSQVTAGSAAEDKGKGKAVDNNDVNMENDDEEEDDDSDASGEEEESDEEEEEDSFQEISPEAILPRRTRGAKVDYTSAAAIEKAGLKADDKDEDDDDDMKQ